MTIDPSGVWTAELDGALDPYAPAPRTAQVRRPDDLRGRWTCATARSSKTSWSEPGRSRSECASAAGRSALHGRCGVGRRSGCASSLSTQHEERDHHAPGGRVLVLEPARRRPAGPRARRRPRGRARGSRSRGSPRCSRSDGEVAGSSSALRVSGATWVEVVCTGMTSLRPSDGPLCARADVVADVLACARYRRCSRPGSTATRPAPARRGPPSAASTGACSTSRARTSTCACLARSRRRRTPRLRRRC